MCHCGHGGFTPSYLEYVNFTASDSDGKDMSLVFMAIKLNKEKKKHTHTCARAQASFP